MACYGQIKSINLKQEQKNCARDQHSLLLYGANFSGSAIKIAPPYTVHYCGLLYYRVRP